MNEYIKSSIVKLRDTKTIAIMAILLALHIVLSSFYIPVFDNTRIMFTFFIKALAGIIGGPAWALVFGFSSDAIGHIIHPLGAYFPGYTITSICSTLIYSLMLYRQKITVLRLVITKTTVNILCNILLNSFWSYLVLSNGFIYYMIQGTIKNIILLPFEIIILVTFLKILLPMLNKFKYTNQTSIPFIK